MGSDVGGRAMRSGVDRRLAAIMFTDLVGFSALTQEDEAQALDLLHTQQALIGPVLARYDGQLIKSTGDGYLVEFASALEAVWCAIAIQEALQEHNESVDANHPIRLRIGVHLGDVEYRDGDIYGDGVNIASRIEPLADPGSICVSQQVYDQVWNKLDVPLVSMGRRQLRHIRVPLTVYRVALPWENHHEIRAEAESPRSRIAVLPFVNISPDARDAYFADGMTEELIYTISKIHQLRVIAQTSVMTYKNSGKTVAEIGRELSVGTVLEGSVRKSNGHVRINVQLIDVGSEEHLWGERYDRQLEDVFAIQSDIAREVADALEVQLLKSTERRIDQHATSDPEAYSLFLKGRYFWNQRTKRSLERAIDLYRGAIEREPTFAAAYAGLAQAYIVCESWGFLPADEALQEASEAGYRALELDDELAEAYAALAIVKRYREDDPDGAEAFFGRAIDLNPNDATAHHWYAVMLSNQSRKDEALAQIQKAGELDPLSPVIMIAHGQLLMHDFNDADSGIAMIEKALELSPEFPMARAELIEAHMRTWNWEAAARAIDDALAATPEDPLIRLIQADYHLALGRLDDAEADLAHVQGDELSSLAEILHLGGTLAWLGRGSEAIERFQQALAIHPKHEKLHYYIGLVHLGGGEHERALSAFKAIEACEDPWLALALAVGRALAHLGLGNRDRAHQIRNELRGHPDVEKGAYQLALLHAHLGDLDEAFRWLEQALDRRDSWVIRLQVDPLLEPLRDDERYERLLQRMGLAR